MNHHHLFDPRRLLSLTAIACLYYISARFGLVLQLPATNASPVWPPSGIALFSVMVFGFSVWPGIALGAFFANLMTLPLTLNSLGASLSISVGNTLEAVVALYFIRRFISGSDLFQRARSVFILFGVAALASVIAGTNGAFALYLWGIIPQAAVLNVWFTWWLGDFAGMLVLAPALYCWWMYPRLNLSPARIAELVGLLFTALLLTELIFGGWITSEILVTLPYLLVPVLLWVTFRFGPRETSIFSVCISFLAIADSWQALTMGTRSAFTSLDASANDTLVMVQIFVCAISGTAMTLAASLTEKAQASAALEASEALARINEKRFRAVFEQAAVGVGLVNPTTGHFIHVNQRFAWMFGYSPEEMRHLTFHEITHPDDLKVNLDYARRLIAGEISTFSIEKRYFRKDRSLIFVNLSVSTIWEGEAKVPLHIAFVQDMTERRQAEDLFRTMVETSPIGKIMVAKNGIITLTNFESEKIFGYGPGELLGRPIESLFARAAWYQVEAQSLADNKNPLQGQVPLHRQISARHRNGTEIPLEMTLTQLHTNGEEFSLASIVDISEQKKTEVALPRSESLLRQITDAAPASGEAADRRT